MAAQRDRTGLLGLGFLGKKYRGEKRQNHHDGEAERPDLRAHRHVTFREIGPTGYSPIWSWVTEMKYRVNNYNSGMLEG